MSIFSKISSALGRRDEVPNQELAKAIVAVADTHAISELIENLSNKSKDIQSDCIKVLYEIGALKPILIAPHISAFAKLLDNKNNRLAWGAMTALDTVTKVAPHEIYAILPQIIAVADSGSVITRDHALGILIQLMEQKKYADDCFALLLEQLTKCPTNQLPMYAENAAPAILAKQKSAFIRTLTERLGEIEKDSKRARIEKIIRKIGK
ncbi:MAG: hypothetical protein ACKVU0_17500 [Saprospiraceae bacterium]